MSISIITPPDPEKPAITTALLKSHLSILADETDYDAILEMYLGSAVDEFTSKTKRAVIYQTVRQSFDQFPYETYFRLERAPLVSFTSLQYRNSAGAWVVVDPAIYSVDPLEQEPIVQLSNNRIWPGDISVQGYSNVRVQYVCGYGADETAIPFDIKRILCMIVGDSYLYREDSDARPGAGLVIVNPSSINAMRKYMLNYFEHKSQRLRLANIPWVRPRWVGDY